MVYMGGGGVVGGLGGGEKGFGRDMVVVEVRVVKNGGVSGLRGGEKHLDQEKVVVEVQMVKVLMWAA